MLDHAHLHTVGTASATALAVGLLGQPVAIGFLTRRQIVDVPNERSSHSTVTPRGGGIAIVLAIAVGLAIAPATRQLYLPLLAFGAIGFAEDLVGVAIPARLGLQLLTGAMVGYVMVDGTSPATALLIVAACAIWLTGYVNAFNFMDGLNGMAGVNATVAGGLLCLVGLRLDLPVLAGGGLVTAAAAGSFLPYNAVRAKIFLGDVGSYALGGVLATLAAYAVVNGVPIETALGPMALYLADTGWTLLRRIRSGETWYQAHRTHVYQRLTDLGLSHQRVTAVCAALTIVVGTCGTAALTGNPAIRVGADLVALGALWAYLRSPVWLDSRRATASPVPSGVPVP